MLMGLFILPVVYCETGQAYKCSSPRLHYLWQRKKATERVRTKRFIHISRLRPPEVIMQYFILGGHELATNYISHLQSIYLTSHS